MRFKLSIAALLSTAATPAFAHPEHGFQLPDVLHIVTQADHLAVAAGVVVLMSVIGGIAFKRSSKK